VAFGRLGGLSVILEVRPTDEKSPNVRHAYLENTIVGQ